MKKSRKTGDRVEVVWSEFASEMLMKTHDYYAEVVGISVAKRIISKIFKTTEQLKTYPQSGQIETTLKPLKEGHQVLGCGQS